MKTLAPSAGQKLPALRPGEFRYVTKGIDIETVEGPDGQSRRRFHTIMSSTVSDARGDQIKPPALIRMRDQFQEGRTIFLNHEYKVPEDVFGTSDTAEIKSAGHDADGTPIWDLHIWGNVNIPNPRAVQLADSIDGKYVRFGASIGAIVRKHKKNDAGGMDIWDVDTKEGSIVGIPMQQRAWVQKAADAAALLGEESEGDFIPWFDDGEDYLIEKELQMGDEPSTVDTAIDTTTTITSTSTAIPLGGTNIRVGEAGPEAVKGLNTDTGAALQVQGLEAKGEKCPGCGHGASCDCSTCDCSSDYHDSTKSVASAADLGPDAKVAGDDSHDDTSADGQEAEVATPEPEGAPEAEGATPETASEEADDAEKAYDDQDVITLAFHARDLAATVNERDETIKALTAERDQLASEVGMANDAIKKVLAMPLSRQAVGHIASLDERLPSFLAPEVKDFLTKSAGERT